MKRLLVLSLFLSLFYYKNAHAQLLNSVVIDTPTAYTVERGSYHFMVLGYDNGGIEMKTFIGLHDNLYLGVSF